MWNWYKDSCRNSAQGPTGILHSVLQKYFTGSYRNPSQGPSEIQCWETLAVCHRCDSEAISLSPMLYLQFYREKKLLDTWKLWYHNHNDVIVPCHVLWLRIYLRRWESEIKITKCHRKVHGSRYCCTIATNNNVYQLPDTNEISNNLLRLLHAMHALLGLWSLCQKRKRKPHST